MGPRKPGQQRMPIAQPESGTEIRVDMLDRVRSRGVMTVQVLALAAMFFASCLPSRGPLSRVQPLSAREQQLSGCYSALGVREVADGSVVLLDTVALGAFRVRLNRLGVEGQRPSEGAWRSHWFIDALRGDSVVIGPTPGRRLVLVAAGDSMSGNEYGFDDMGRYWREASGVVLKRQRCPSGVAW